MTMKPLDDDRVEGLIAHLLRAGVVIAALVVIGGAVPYLGQHPRAHVDYRTFHGEPDNLKAVHTIIRTALSGDPRGIMQLGLLLLIAGLLSAIAGISGFAFSAVREVELRLPDFQEVEEMAV